MGITTLSSRELNQDTSRAKQAASRGPVFITDRGRPGHVLLRIEDYQKLVASHTSIIDQLAMPGVEDIELDPPERRNAEQGAVRRAWMENYVLPAFSERVLAIDTAVARRCAQLHVPDPKSERDAFIAATALAHGMPVVSRNVADFSHTGVAILNPWNQTTGGA